MSICTICQNLERLKHLMTQAHDELKEKAIGAGMTSVEGKDITTIINELDLSFAGNERLNQETQQNIMNY